MIIVPLGVASATPTATRHLSSTALWREGSVFLFDCGENTQMSMLQGGLKRSQIEYIFISHFDTDHYSGLIGLLSTLQLQRREKPITLVGPAGLQEFVEWNFNFADVELKFEVNYVELDEDFEEGRVVDEEEFYIEARPLNHTKFCVGYRFQEKDKPGKVDAEKAAELGISEDWQFKQLKAGEDVKLDDGTVAKSIDIVGHPRPGDSFAYITDTRYCPNSVKLAKNTNILYHETTFANNLAAKADETGHSTAQVAARVAGEAKTKLLVITHFSARYTNQYELLRQARDDFFPTWIATELRPIFTDPAHEKGIIKSRVYIKEIDHNKSRKKKYSKKPTKKRFRKRKKDRDNNTSNKYRESYNNDNADSNSNGSKSDGDGHTQRKPKPITPRTPFDDFDRF